MLYASSKDALRKKLVGVHLEVQATDMDEVEYDEIYQKVSAGGTK
jgi:cofilin